MQKNFWDRLFSSHVCERLCEWEVSNTDILVKLILSHKLPTVKSYRNCGMFQCLYPVLQQLCEVGFFFFKKKQGEERQGGHFYLTLSTEQKVTGEMPTEYLLQEFLKACLSSR